MSKIATGTSPRLRVSPYARRMSSRAHPNCGTCKGARGELDAPGPVIYEDRLWFLAHMARPIAMAGWLVLAPRRHIESVAALTPAEARALGPLVTRAAALPPWRRSTYSSTRANTIATSAARSSLQIWKKMRRRHPTRQQPTPGL